MMMRTHTLPEAPRTAASNLPGPLWLQRSCASDGRAGSGGECDEYRKQRLQAELAVGPFHDPLEEEAGRVADRVLSSAERVAGTAPLATTRLSGGHAGADVALATVNQVFSSAAAPMHAPFKQDVEASFGNDFLHVWVHAGSVVEASAQKIDAQAHTADHYIVFGSGHFDTSSSAGRCLTVQELMHVVQQSGSAPAGLQRLGAPAPTPPTEPVEPNATQQGIIDAARRATAVRSRVTTVRANGIESERWQREAIKLAHIKFNWPSPNMDQIGEILPSTGGRQITVRMLVAPSGDSECGPLAGDVHRLRPPIEPCPSFFDTLTSDESRIRTMVHEMTHARVIGDASPAEEHLPIFDCDSVCSFELAHSWAIYVHYMSGQQPDQPELVIGNAAGGGGS